MDRICNDRKRLIITLGNELSVILLSLEQFRPLEETVYFLHSPVSATQLLAAAKQLNEENPGMIFDRINTFTWKA